ncbi:MAG: serine/threonine protein kinase, partial [Sandaracinaceae bacterium]|nr:serine/threonine protein kinase [Sandaracinaceae bacterium]
RYRITGLVAVGGMGCIYDALDEREGERVALKTLQPRFAERPRVVGRFLREAQALARAHSPHIVSISAHGRLPDGRAYYVMELMRGQTLSDAIEGAGGPLEPVRAVRLAQQIAAGLGHAHAIGMVHRDLKPENVFLCELEDGREHVKILDFGLAKALDGSMDVTVGDEVLGTPCYMAPEQVFGRRADARTDVYACGVVLYEMLTGRVPFDGEAAVDIMRAHVEEAPRPPSQLDPPCRSPSCSVDHHVLPLQGPGQALPVGRRARRRAGRRRTPLRARLIEVRRRVALDTHAPPFYLPTRVEPTRPAAGAPVPRAEDPSTRSSPSTSPRASRWARAGSPSATASTSRRPPSAT